MPKDKDCIEDARISNRASIPLDPHHNHSHYNVLLRSQLGDCHQWCASIVVAVAAAVPIDNAHWRKERTTQSWIVVGESIQHGDQIGLSMADFGTERCFRRE
jgi:hypothetical protein